jgi:hypothetical protein
MWRDSVIPVYVARHRHFRLCGETPSFPFMWRDTVIPVYVARHRHSCLCGETPSFLFMWWDTVIPVYVVRHRHFRLCGETPSFLFSRMKGLLNDSKFEGSNDELQGFQKPNEFQCMSEHNCLLIFSECTHNVLLLNTSISLYFTSGKHLDSLTNSFIITAYSMRLGQIHITVTMVHYYTRFFHGSTATVGLGVLIVGVSRLHSNSVHSVWLLWTGNRPFVQTSTWQHTTLTTDRYSCAWWNSILRSQQANGRILTP